MGIKFFFIYFSLLAIALNSISAQERLSEIEKESFKQKVKTDAKNTHSILSEFTEEKHLSVLSNKVESKGRLIFLEPDNIKWEYTHPQPNTTIIKANHLYNDSGDKTKNINLESNQTFQKFAALILNSVKGDLFDEEQFEISYYKIDTDILVRFIPKDKRFKKMIPSMELSFNKNSAVLKGLRINEKNGDYTQIRFIDRKINVPIKNDEFKI